MPLPTWHGDLPLVPACLAGRTYAALLCDGLWAMCTAALLLTCCAPDSGGGRAAAPLTHLYKSVATPTGLPRRTWVHGPRPTARHHLWEPYASLTSAISPEGLTAHACCAVLAACPDNTRFVVATNGDNEYEASFVATVLAVPQDVDVVALDFYSRYQRATGEQLHGA